MTPLSTAAWPDRQDLQDEQGSPSIAPPLPAAAAQQPPTKQPRHGSTALSRAHQGATINWNVLFFMALFHAGAVAALFFFSWGAVLAAAILYVLAINFGIGACYHRLLTHRGYSTPKWLEYALAVCATLSLEGGPLVWVATHRVHHQLTDCEGDPHSPREGGWWAHAGWTIHGAGAGGHPELLTKYAPDIERDRFLHWLDTYHYVPLVAVTLALAVFGGWSYVLWGTFLRVTLGLHATWLVNSATHMWGSRRFDTQDDSRNSWWVALLTGGEGWHNNHHAHPVSARHGLAWYEVDVNWYIIWAFARLGLARKVRVARLPEAG